VKILIFIEHDVIIRHFIHSNVFSDISKKHEVTYIFPEPGYKRVTIDVSKLNLSCPYKHLEVHQRRLSIWKRLFQVDLLRPRRDKLFKSLRKLHKEMIGPKAAIFYSILSLPIVYEIFRSYSFLKIKFLPNLKFNNLIEKEKPDLVIHPSVLEGAYINDLISITKEMNIPSMVIMNSWDNPCTKRSMVGAPDWLLVWGQQTWQHAIDYVGMKPRNIIKFGAAQFDVYRGKPRFDRRKFCEVHDIDQESKIILYAGSSKETDEFSHLVLIEEAIKRGELGNSVVVYRPYPWGRGGKDGHRILDNKWQYIRIESTMKKYLESIRIGDTSMTFPDYRDTHDTLSSIDVLVSPLSTIILEGALHGKPSLCFLPIEESEARHFQLVLPLKHFEDMFNMNEFPVAKGHDELITGIQDILLYSEDKQFLKDLKNACRHFVESHSQSFSKRFTALCESIVYQ
jgi:hypothetical protein